MSVAIFMEEHVRRVRDLRSLVAVLLVIGVTWQVMPTQASSLQKSHVNAGGQVRFAYFGGPDTKKLIDKILPSFYKANKGVTVALEPFPDSRVKAVTEIAAGTGPDVFMLGDGDTLWYTDKGALANLMPFIKKDKFDLKGYIKGTLTIGQHKGGLYALPKDYSPLAVYYNKDMFKAAGVPTPSAHWTWTEFRRDALKLTNGGVYGAALPGDWPRAVDAVVRSLGGKLDNSNGTKVVGYMDSGATVKAVQFWLDLFLKDKVAPTPAQASSLGSGDLFASQKAAMNLTGIWPSLGATGYPKTLSFKWGVAPFPTGKDSKHVNTICWAGFGMSKTAKNKNASWGLIKAMAGPVGDNVWGTVNGLPSLKVVAKKNNVYKNPVAGTFLREVRFAEFPSDINGPAAPQGVGDVFNEALKLLLNTPNAGSTQQVLNIEAQKGQKALDAYYGR